jgi:chromosome segregation ATPase
MYNIVETISNNLSELVQTMSKMQEKIDKLEKELAEEKKKNKIFKKSIENKENMPDWELPIQAY